MTERTAPSGIGQSYVEQRRAWIAAALGDALHPVGEGAEPLSEERLEYLVREAEELYWNELSWEQLTDEECVVGGHLTELVFPGLLAFVDGLLLEQTRPDSLAPARPHPDAVEGVLSFLGERYADLSAELDGGVDSQKVLWARAMTSHLIDLVLGRLYRVSPAEREIWEARA